MVLSRVTVNPGAKLALHHHRGTQISRVVAGTLTYTVESGSAVVREGEADQNPTKVRAANRGSVPVVIYLATLLETGAPPSTPVP